MSKLLTIVLVTACLTLVASAAEDQEAPHPRLRLALERHDAAVKRAEDEYKRLLLVAKRGYLRDLERALNLAMSERDADAVAVLRAEKERAQAEINDLTKIKPSADAVKFGGHAYKFIEGGYNWHERSAAASTWAAT